MPESGSNGSAAQSREIFTRALEIPPGPDREQFLDSACGSDSVLREEVESLLQSYDETESFLDTSASGRAMASQDGIIGTQIGRYRIIESIGEGGFGEVYRAEQTEPMRREVALKIIKPGMDSREAIARFESERQALALMDHPNIAHVFDADTTENGRLYFVMELVCGVPITTFCDDHQLELPVRLKLFQQVCGAVQHAHQKGIMHRDLKPSNIVVVEQDGLPVPKIIDFGIAKSLQGRLIDRTVVTQREVFIGTPAYMSPEQIDLASDQLDTRTDIYSLGVLLYELIAGVQPFENDTLQRAVLVEVQRIIREVDPVRPSIRLHTLGDTAQEVARRRATELPTLERRLRGDLDWIVMKAIEKDRDRRYQGVGELADDVSRFLDDEPIVAGPPGYFYRLRKFVRRHRFGMTFATALAVTIVIGLVISVIGFTRARSEALRANRNLYESNMRVAYGDWNAGQVGRVLETLKQHVPRDREADLRGWEWYYLLSLCHQQSKVVEAHDDMITTVALSGDQSRMATIDVTCRLRIWDTETWEMKGEPNVDHIGISDERDEARMLAWSPDGLSLASINPRGTISIRNTIDFEERLLLRADQGAERWKVRSVAWSPDGGRIAGCVSPSDDRNDYMVVWDANTGELLHRMVDWRTEPVHTTLAWSPDGKTLASGESLNGKLVISDPDQGKLLEAFVAHSAPLAAMAWSPDSSRLATGSYDSSVRVWNAGRWNLKFEILTAHNGKVFSVDWNQGGDRLVTGGEDGLIKVWDADNGALLHTLRGHSGEVRSTSWSKDGAQIFSGGHDGSIMVWDPSIAGGWRSRAGRSSFAFSPDGDRLIVPVDLEPVSGPGIRNIWSVGHPTKLEVIDVRSGEVTHTLPFEISGICRGLSWHPGGSMIAINGWGDFVIWHVDKGEMVFVHEDLISRTLAWDREGKRLAIAGREKKIRIWDLEKGDYVQEIPKSGGCGHISSSVAWHPDGRRLAVSCIGNHVVIWDVASAEMLHLLSGPELSGSGSPNNTSWSPDGKFLASGFGDGSIILWDGNSAEELNRLTGHTSPTVSIDWSPDGRRLTSLSNDATIRFWDPIAGRELLVLPTTPAYSESPTIKWSPDGRLFGATGSDLRIFDATKGYEIAPELEALVRARD